jgi:glucose/arabinose dehydrogenase
VPRSLVVPPGFGVRVYARVQGARFMAVAPNGDLLVSNPGAGRVYLVRPSPGGGDPQVSEWAGGLYRPHDIVFHTLGGQTWVYVAEGDKVARYAYTAGDATGRGRQVVVSGLPSNSSPELQGAYGHELKNIALSGDRLYVSIASTCNACLSDAQSDPLRGAVYEYNAAGGGMRLFARGLRNAEGLAFAPNGAGLWATVNNRDNIAYPHHRDFDGDGQDDYGRVMQAYVDNHPPEAFTRVRDGGDYGWPFCNSDADTPNGVDDMPLLRDVQFNGDGSRRDCNAVDRSSKGMQAHGAPLGVTFLHGTNAPQPYRNGALIALHGSWNRSTKTGYKVVHFPWDGGAGRPGAETEFVTGWATATTQWGRPVDVAVAPDGAIYVSDDYSGTIYRVARGGGTTPPSGSERQLVGQQSGRCLDVLGESREPGATLVVWDCWNGANQRWTVPPVGQAGEVRIYGDQCLDLWGMAGNDGDRVSIFPCHGGANQQWTLTSGGELRGMNGRCVDVWGYGTANGSEVKVYACHGDANQRWDARP